MYFVVLDENSLVKRAGSAKSVSLMPAEALKVVIKKVPEEGEVRIDQRPSVELLSTMQVIDDLLTERPELGDDVTVDTLVTLPLMPAGSIVEIFDVSGGELMTPAITAPEDDWSDEITFVGTGLFRIEITPPSPYLPKTISVSF